MECSKVQEKLSCYLDGALDEATLEAVEHHLEHCAECRKELLSLRAVVDLASVLLEVDPPATLSSAIKDAVSRERDACAEYLPILSEHIDGELSEELIPRLEAHLASCKSCEREYILLQHAVDAMDLVTEVDPPANLRNRIAAATTRRWASRVALIRDRAVSVLASPRLGWAAGLAAAAALVGFLAIQPYNAHQKPTVKINPSKSPAAAKFPYKSEFSKPVTAVAEVPKDEDGTPKVAKQAIVAYKPVISVQKSGMKTVLKPETAKTLLAGVAKNQPNRIATAPTLVIPIPEKPLSEVIAESPVQGSHENRKEASKTVSIKLQNKHTINNEDLSKYFKDVKTAARMNERDKKGIRIDVVTKKF